MTYKMSKELESGLRRAYEAAKADAWLLDHFDGVIRINGKEFPINGFIGILTTDTVYIRNGRYDRYPVQARLYGLLKLKGRS